MAARSSTEEQRRRRRRRLVKGILLGGAAVGVPALLNAVVARRARRLEAAAWGRGHRYAWRYGELSFQRLGEGPPVLFLHSFGPGHDSEEWRSAAELLARRWRIYALDLLGWGRSDKPGTAYDGELFIAQIGDFLADVVRERVAIAAAGLPAAYAVQVGVDLPEAVTALALSVPAGIDLNADEPDLKDAVLHRLLRLPVLGASALNLYTSRPALTAYLRKESFAAPERVDAALVEHHYRSSHQPGAQQALAAYLAGYLNHSVREALSRLKAPLWLGWGRNATSPPVESADLWLAQRPEARLEVFEGAGNLPHAEAPGRFAQRLERFLDTAGA